MVIEVLGRVITKKDDEIQTHLKTIEHLNKKISMFESYIDTYEKILDGGAGRNENSSSDIDAT